MSVPEQVRKIEAIHEDTGQPVVAYVIPDGYVCVLVPEEMAKDHEDWQDCSAVRMVPASDDGRVALFEIEGER